MSDPNEGSTARRRKLFVYADAIGLSRDERLELAENVLRTDVASWKDLTDTQVNRMLDALEGATLVLHLIGQRS